jgi:hypothetical protein
MKTTLSGAVEQNTYRNYRFSGRVMEGRIAMVSNLLQNKMFFRVTTLKLGTAARCKGLRQALLFSNFPYFRTSKLPVDSKVFW